MRRSSEPTDACVATNFPATDTRSLACLPGRSGYDCRSLSAVSCSMSTYIGKWRWVNEEDDTKALLGIVVQEDPDEYPPLLVYKNQSMSEFDVMARVESEEIASLAAERIDRILTADEFARIGGATVAEGLGLRGEEANDHPGVEWVCALKDNDDPDPAVRVTGGADGRHAFGPCRAPTAKSSPCLPTSMTSDGSSRSSHPR